MSLGSKQRAFTLCISKLIRYAYSLGYELTFGDAYRSPTNPDGHERSCHRVRLAVDFNLFKDGEYLTETEDHQELGEFWEALHPDACWGGRFKDGNHYSFEYNGVK
mgnify:CR=1 FL=1